MIRKSRPIVWGGFVWLVAGFAVGWGQTGSSIHEDIAPVDRFSEPFAVTNVELILEAVPDQNLLRVQAACTFTHDHREPPDAVDFDILGRDKWYGLHVSGMKVARVSKGDAQPQPFVHAPLDPCSDSTRVGTSKCPKVTRVLFPGGLKGGEAVTLRFSYDIRHLDPARQDLPYRIAAQCPDGRKEICLLSDFSWLPRINMDFGLTAEMNERNFFAKMPLPAWTTTVIHPSHDACMVVDGRLENVQKKNAVTVCRWASHAAIGFPSLHSGVTAKDIPFIRWSAGNPSRKTAVGGPPWRSATMEKERSSVPWRCGLEARCGAKPLPFQKGNQGHGRSKPPVRRIPSSWIRTMIRSRETNAKPG